jgi:hypothetical protein
MKPQSILSIAGAALLVLSISTPLARAAEVVQEKTTTTTSTGTISEFGPDVITIRSETAAEPIRYSYSKTTTYVDESGAPVSIETVKSGLPVTVYYVKEGDRMVASKVIVKRTTTKAPPRVEKETTTTTTTKSKDD